MAVDTDQIQNVDATGAAASSGCGRRRIRSVTSLPSTGLGRNHVVIGLHLPEIDGNKLHGTTEDTTKGIETVLGDGHVHKEGGDDSLGMNLGGDGPELGVGLGTDGGYATPRGGRGGGGSRRRGRPATSLGLAVVIVVFIIIGIMIEQIAHVIVDGKSGSGRAMTSTLVGGAIIIIGRVVVVVVGILIVKVATIVVAGGARPARRPKAASQIKETNGTVREAGNDVPARGGEGKAGACAVYVPSDKTST